MAKRPYTKKSGYWTKFEKVDLSDIPPAPKVQGFTPSFGGRGIMEESFASRAAGAGGTTGNRRNNAATSIIPLKYACINEGILPYGYTKNGVDVRESLLLCQKAYANVPIVKNSVDLMAEFANSEVYLTGGNAASRTFFQAWFSVIRLENLKSQYFLEYYRGSNIFLYKQMGNLSADQVQKLSRLMSSKERLGKAIPIKYILLNPVDIVGELTSSFSAQNRQFYKVLSSFELERLKNPKNDVDVQVLNSFPPDVRAQIQKGQFQNDGIRITLNPALLLYSFAKKQDYEPFAIPFIFPVLSDVNAKMEMKKLDQAVMRTIENIVLLITLGAKPEDGGINQQNVTAMQTLFQNEAVGRVVVADYTTKADFVIPDISKIVGIEKYAILNEDIKEGLQNIVTGEDKYAATAIKAQLFVERLNESRNAFLNDVLIPEMYLVANALGFKDVPVPVFTETTLKDEVQFTRAVTRLMELSILTPEEGVRAIQTGNLPNPDEFLENQKAYKLERDSGLYYPLIGGSNPAEAPPVPGPTGSAPTGKSVTKAAPKPNVKKVPNQNGRPIGSTAAKAPTRVSVAAIKSSVYLTDKFFEFGKQHATKIEGSLSAAQLEIVEELCKSIISAKESQEWESSFQECFKDKMLIVSLYPMSEVSDIASEFDTDLYEAALIYHGNSLPN